MSVQRTEALKGAHQLAQDTSLPYATLDQAIRPRGRGKTLDVDLTRPVPLLLPFIRPRGRGRTLGVDPTCPVPLLPSLLRRTAPLVLGTRSASVICGNSRTHPKSRPCLHDPHIAATRLFHAFNMSRRRSSCPQTVVAEERKILGVDHRRPWIDGALRGALARPPPPLGLWQFS